MFKIGDKVSVLDEDLTGRITSVTGETVTIVTEDGFEMQFDKNELVRISNEAYRSLPPSPPDTPSGRVSQPWAIVGSLVPGLLVHGTGSWLSGDDDTARRLLLLQGGGIALTGGSLAALALTGAARDWVGLFATTSVLGVGAMGVSLLANIYRTAAPEGFGSHPGHVPWGDTEIGVLSVTNPQLELGPIVSLSANIRTARWTTAIRTWHAPWSLHARAHLETGFQFWGAREDTPDVRAGGGHTTLFFGITGERYGLESFSSYGSELRLETRIDSEHLAPNVRGAFVDWELGYAARRTAFSLTRTYNDDSLLIAGVGFGAYHGDPLRNGGATRFYYNHRHDGYAGGMLIGGIGSGVAGRIGLESRHFITPTWGVRLGVEKGAAWVIGIHLITRIWNQSSLLNSISNSLTPSQPSPDAKP